MNKIEKLLNKIPRKDKEKILAINNLILEGKFEMLDIAKLKGRDDRFRIRVGKYRIFYKIVDNLKIIYKIERRSDTTYS